MKTNNGISFMKQNGYAVNKSRNNHWHTTVSPLTYNHIRHNYPHSYNSFDNSNRQSKQQINKSQAGGITPDFAGRNINCIDVVSRKKLFRFLINNPEEIDRAQKALAALGWTNKNRSTEEGKIAVLSVGGSLIVPSGGDGSPDAAFLIRFKEFIGRNVAEGRQFVCIAGGGQLTRKYQKIQESITKTNPNDRDWVGIPVYTMRKFFHTNVIVREGAGINSPEDLKGKRIGVPPRRVVGPVGQTEE